MNERARVPFALVGVVLLVGSATLSAGLGGVAVSEPDTEAAMEEARVALGGDLRDATGEAARVAAANPVTAPANTTLGRALARTGRPFRASLELRTYLALRERLDRTRGQGVRVSASLPGLSTAGDLRAALERTSVERVGANGTALRATVENVTLVAKRDGQVVERQRVSPTVEVVSPVLALHERTVRFDRRLDADATAPGLARRATARLYALAWTRGLAQYGGAPIANVVGNRHVAVATNGALLAEQRAVFGTADDAAVRATRTAATRAAGTDLLAAAGASGSETEALLRAADGAVPGSTLDPTVAGSAPAVGPDDTLSVDVNGSADDAFRTFADDGLAEAVDATYRVRARRRVRVTRSETTRSGHTAPRGENWTLVGSEETTTLSAVNESAAASGVAAPWHVLSTAAREVTERRTVVRRWRRGNRTVRTTAVVTTTNHVRIVVVGRHDGGQAPPREVQPIHDRGGALGGPNLGAVAECATTRLVAARGGVDAVARRAVAGTLGGNETTVSGERPARLRPWIYRDLVTLRERVRNVSVAVERGAVGIYTANPAADLATAVRNRRAALLDAPARYDGVADRARIAARAAYLDAVLTELDRRAEHRHDVGDRFASLLANHGLSRDRLAALLDASAEPRMAERGARSDTAGETFVVEGAPAYLSLSRVRRARTDARGSGSTVPLAARNTNLFTVPYGDVADGVVGHLFGEGHVRLRTAARALQSAERLAAKTDDDRVGARRDRLRAAVLDATDRRRSALRAALSAAGVGETTADRQAVVRAGLSQWERPSSRAVALTNGSAAETVAAVAAERYPGAVGGPESSDRLRLALRAAATTGDGVPESAVNASVTATKRAVTDVVTEVTARAANRTATTAMERAERRLGRSLARVPSGLPVTPLPSQWYATTNVWLVEARGAYDRFVVRTREGFPGRTLAYVRDGSSVRLDWDADGDAERAGRASEVDLSVETAVVVVVPPGGQGVGDTDGNADERSSGWNRERQHLWPRRPER